MRLQAITLFHFRTYKDATFRFETPTTIIVGPNTSGKSNLIEALTLLSTGKSFKTDKDIQMVAFGQDITRIKGKVDEVGEDLVVEVLIAKNEQGTFTKKFLVNDLPRRRVDFATHIPVILFSPEDLDVIIDGPSLRRKFLDEAIEQVDLEYAQATTGYSKALRQRNALLEKSRTISINLQKQFSFWDEELIKYGEIITSKREAFIAFLNTQEKVIFDCNVLYDKSVISKDRLAQYENEERFSGVTLVGPHRDDFKIELFHEESGSTKDIRYFGSRGQQRLVIFQLKLLQIPFIVQYAKKTPLLLLDDIFSELDSRNITRVIAILGDYQTIITTTHKEFVPEALAQSATVIELGK